MEPAIKTEEKVSNDDGYFVGQNLIILCVSFTGIVLSVFFVILFVSLKLINANV